MRLVDMKRLIPILCVALSLTACSGPGSSSDVALSKDPYPTNQEFPHGDCDDDPTFAETNTGCGWVHINERSYYIMPNPGERGTPRERMALYRAKLSGANLSGANLKGADLREASLDDATLTNSMLTNSIMRFAYLYRSDLSGANLSGAILDNANLNNADLRGADLRGATLRGARLRGAKLKGVKADSSTACPNTKRWGTAGNDCGFYDNDNDFPFGSCESQDNNPPGDRTGCGWVHVNSNSYYIMPDANLRGANLHGADLRNAILTDAILTEAILWEALLNSAKLRGADLSRANLGEANLNNSDLTGANLSGADLRGTDLHYARLTDAILSDVRANTRIVCPNGKERDSRYYDHNCPF